VSGAAVGVVEGVSVVGFWVGRSHVGDTEGLSTVGEHVGMTDGSSLVG